MDKILVLGASGMVGSKFVERYGGEMDLLLPDEKELDLTEEKSVADYFEAHREIGTVINLAAYTNVSEAQKQRGDKNGLCWRINVRGAENLAKALKGKKIFWLHISTDMVFAGDESDPGPYAEDHEVVADEKRLSWYGYTKAKAEEILGKSLGMRLAILRLIYPVTSEYALKADYLRGPLEYYRKNGQLYPVFNDQQMNISDIDEVAEVMKILVERQEAGIFHAGSRDIRTPYKIISQLFKEVYGNSDMVKPGSLAEFLKKTDDPTRYPMFGGLLNEKTRKRLGIEYSSCGEIVEKLYEGRKREVGK